MERFPLPPGALDGLRYFIVALPEPSINYLIYFGQLIGTYCTHLFRRILLVSNPVRPGSEIYGLNLLEAAVPYEAVLSSWFRLPAVNLPSTTARQTFSVIHCLKWFVIIYL